MLAPWVGLSEAALGADRRLVGWEHNKCAARFYRISTNY